MNSSKNIHFLPIVKMSDRIKRKKAVSRTLILLITSMTKLKWILKSKKSEEFIQLYKY